MFNSSWFLLLFLPFTLGVYFLLGWKGYFRLCVGWLTAASIFFYGSWAPVFLIPFLAAILFNYGVGTRLIEHGSRKPVHAKAWLSLGIAANLFFLGYFKYKNFFIDNFNTAFDTSYPSAPVVFPIGISFITFQQISYLVDAYRGQIKECNFVHYLLYVALFPKIFAGPIVRYGDLAPQLERSVIGIFSSRNLVEGVTLFVIGLFKKLMLADTLAPYADAAFGEIATGTNVHFFKAWGGSWRTPSKSTSTFPATPIWQSASPES